MTSPHPASVPVANMPETTVSTLPVNLPDQRTAYRLLDVLDRLTRHVQQLQREARGVAQQPMENDPQMLALQQENATLKARQAAAKARLEALLARVQQVATQPHNGEPEATEQAA